MATMTPTEVPEESDAAHGRIGYGRYARYTPLALAALLIAGLGLIGLFQGADETGAPRPAAIVGKAAPDVTLTLLDGTPLRLADHRGEVVVLNFWASWCEPCKEEMPLFQAYSDEARRQGEATTIIGVGIRTDHDADARAFVRDLGLTYPIGRDTNTDEPGRGPIERAFEVPNAYPTTLFIRPDGIIDRVHLGPLTAGQLREAVEAARDE